MNYQSKDFEKFAKCNKLITRGVVGSSSHKYMFMHSKWDINTGEYTCDDIVGVSVNGNRKNRVKFDSDEVYQAIDAGARIITDNQHNRERPYNIGERELAKFMVSYGCKYFDHPKGGVWIPPNSPYYK